MSECETQALLAALEQAEEWSRQLDARIVCLVRGWKHFDRVYGSGFKDAGGKFVDLGWNAVPHYTTSIDAALPGEDVACVVNLDGHTIATARDKQGEAHLGDAKTEALARRCAALRARQASGEAEG